MESAYYLFQRTHDQIYQDMGKVFLDSLVTYWPDEAGYTELDDVVTKTKRDRMEPYFMAETMKYLYLLFAPSEILPFGQGHIQHGRTSHNQGVVMSGLTRRDFFTVVGLGAPGALLVNGRAERIPSGHTQLPRIPALR